MHAPTDWRVRACIWTIGRPENGGRVSARQPNEVLIKVPIRLFERVGFHRTAHAFLRTLEGRPAAPSVRWRISGATLAACRLEFTCISARASTARSLSGQSRQLLKASPSGPTADPSVPA